MIIQGANNPLAVKFSESVDEMASLVITLWREDKLIKKWETDDMAIDGDTALCPITEEETAALISTPHILAAKGLDGDGETVFWNEYKIDVMHRHDKNITLTQVGD